jgi:hypothetical protein
MCIDIFKAQHYVLLSLIQVTSSIPEFSEGRKLRNFLRSSGSGTGSTQNHEDN